MRSEIFCLLAVAVVAAYATSEVVPSATQDERTFNTVFTFTTFTLMKTTTTTTSTLTSTTTCTTSTATLSTCTVGGRRRGLFFDEKDGKRARRGLFYNDDETENKDGSVFLPTAEKAISDPVEEAPAKPVAEDSVIPLEVQAGFSLPQGAEGNRFLLAFGTSTVTKFTVTTTTAKLTAICSSTTGFSLCAASGKK